MYLQKLIKANLHENVLYKKEETNPRYKSSDEINHVDALEIDRQFYTKLPQNLIKQLYDIIYEPDFQMLGYEYPQKYIDMGYAEGGE